METGKRAGTDVRKDKDGSISINERGIARKAGTEEGHDREWQGKKGQGS